ncbi:MULTISPECIES: tautomerase family protein [Dietzia]|uniref:4-oxalocrotonate tautomerase-like domain-containing protein n=1 Tax=Dietzia cercidiphylli TaxID=498199 RepID=A0ABN2INY5_9ACTN|nr:4-oxalocrotonate tautomerase [Dietzia sp. CQ4]MBB1037210.1 4-oxalocrotonate tautomerase [Dietzia natronolimnaea]MBB1041124.1 4-oxalocrotonate tautomerase [Dietzia sp. Cai40]MBB1044293.1 4-oxalocrotonate tautomerase [Dietzia sp. DQ11-44]MBB1049129.1 4-oxalocrotonate tautomerase [Dietzia cercidiphylli]MBB1052125.1 4-oxalocrotonate tautomerase [Dietzia sp. CW19]MBB1053011.1 4-oxalocrotonate tautomerase [Dietzia sp. B44]MBB1056888.1 4-oxalocrotonate tautomerase [Dietzia sp. B19]MBC7295357.1 
MPFIQINQLDGMDPESKSRVIEAVTAAYAEAAGKDPAKVWVLVNDMPHDSFGIGGRVVG